MLGMLFVGGAIVVAAAVSGLLLLAVRGCSRRVLYAVGGLSAFASLLFVANLATAYSAMHDGDHGVPKGDYAATTMLGGIIGGALMGGVFFGLAALVVMRVRGAGLRAPR